jgi:hydrogenase maturation protein HypF
MVSVASSGRVRVRARVRGTVQGVGFRPFVYRLANEEALGGHVLNDEHGVLLEVEGDMDAVDRFIVRLEQDRPPLADIQSVVLESVPLAGEDEFRIVESSSGGVPDAAVT